MFSLLSMCPCRISQYTRISATAQQSSLMCKLSFSAVAKKLRFDSETNASLNTDALFQSCRAMEILFQLD